MDKNNLMGVLLGLLLGVGTWFFVASEPIQGQLMHLIGFSQPAVVVGLVLVWGVRMIGFRQSVPIWENTAFLTYAALLVVMCIWLFALFLGFVGGFWSQHPG